MIDLSELPDNAAELLHEELEKQFEEMKREKTPDEEPIEEEPMEDGSDVEFARLKDTDQKIAKALGELNAGVYRQERKLSELEELIRLNLKKNERVASRNGRIRTMGIAALLAPVFYGLGRLAVWLVGLLIEGLGGAVGTLVACLFCVTLGLLMLFLSAGGSESPIGKLEKLFWDEEMEEIMLDLDERHE